MQEYREVLETDTVRAAREIYNKNIETLRSNYAGTAFPTENLTLGMKCFRTDEGKTYTLKSLDPLKWEEDGTGGAKKLSREEIISSRVFLDLVGREAIGRLTDWTGLFNRALSLEVMDFLDIGSAVKVTNMSAMFHDCMSLKAVLNFSVPESYPLRDVSRMFQNCDQLTTLDMTAFKVRGVKNFSYMFDGCRALRTIDVSAWDMSGATDLKGMFSGCENLRQLDVSKWNVGNVTNFSELFKGCAKLPVIDVSKWNTAKATAMGSMFAGCRGFVGTLGTTTNAFLHLDLSNFDLSSVETTSHMFFRCTAIAKFGEKFRRTGKCRDMSYMFAEARFSGQEGFTNVASTIAGSGYSPPGVLDVHLWQSIFTMLDYSAVENMNCMFQATREYNSKYNKQVHGGTQEMHGIVFHVSTPNVTTASGLFAKTMTDFIDVSMDTGSLRDISRMFAETDAESIRLRNFDTSRFSGNMDGLFYGCRNLKYLIIDGGTFNFKLVSDVLADLPADCKFLVWQSTIATYKAQNIWKNYGDRFVPMENYNLRSGIVMSTR